MGKTTLLREYVNAKRALPPGMLLLFVDREHGGCLSFGEDAAVLSPIVGHPVRIGRTTMSCMFRTDTLDTALAKIVRVGRSVALASRLADGSGRLEVYRIVQPYE